MSAQRRTSTLPSSRYHPFSSLFSPVRALRQVATQAYRISMNYASTRAHLLVAGRAIVSSAQPSGNRIPGLSNYSQEPARSHDSISSTNGLTDLNAALVPDNEEMNKGSVLSEKLECRFKPGWLCGTHSSNLSSMPGVLDDAGRRGSQKAVNDGRLGAPNAEVTLAGIRNISASASGCDPVEKCALWLRDIEGELEEGEIMDDSGLAVRTWASVTSSFRSHLSPVRDVRRYHFFDRAELGRIKYSPSRKEHTYNCWIYLPPHMESAPALIYELGDIKFFRDGDHFKYFVFSQLPGSDSSYYDRYWVPAKIGHPHPCEPNYNLHHHYNQAPMWLYQAGQPLYPPIVLRNDVVSPTG